MFLANQVQKQVLAPKNSRKLFIFLTTSLYLATVLPTSSLAGDPNTPAIPPLPIFHASESEICHLGPHAYLASTGNVRTTNRPQEPSVYVSPLPIPESSVTSTPVVTGESRDQTNVSAAGQTNAAKPSKNQRAEELARQMITQTLHGVRDAQIWWIRNVSRVDTDAVSPSDLAESVKTEVALTDPKSIGQPSETNQNTPSQKSNQQTVLKTIPKPTIRRGETPIPQATPAPHTALVPQAVFTASVNTTPQPFTGLGVSHRRKPYLNHQQGPQHSLVIETQSSPSAKLIGGSAVIFSLEEPYLAYDLNPNDLQRPKAHLQPPVADFRIPNDADSLANVAPSLDTALEIWNDVDTLLMPNPESQQGKLVELRTQLHSADHLIHQPKSLATESVRPSVGPSSLASQAGDNELHSQPSVSLVSPFRNAELQITPPTAKRQSLENRRRDSNPASFVATQFGHAVLTFGKLRTVVKKEITKEVERQWIAFQHHWGQSAESGHTVERQEKWPSAAGLALLQRADAILPHTARTSNITWEENGSIERQFAEEKITRFTGPSFATVAEEMR